MKIENIWMKNCDIPPISAPNTGCGYPIETVSIIGGGLSGTHDANLQAGTIKTSVYPLKTPALLHKVGL